MTVIVLTGLSGVERSVRNIYKGSVEPETTLQLGHTVVTVAIYGFCTGIPIFSLAAKVYAWVAQRLGGSIEKSSMWVILSWAMLPTLPLIGWMAWLYHRLGEDFFTMRSEELMRAYPGEVLPFAMAQAVLLLWTIGISIEALGELAGLSRVRALGVYLFGGVAVFALYLGEKAGLDWLLGFISENFPAL